MTLSPGVPRSIRVAYLTSQYPATSHTFISREVAAVRQLGLEVHALSIRAPSAAELKDPMIADEAAQTFTVLKQPMRRFISAHLKAILGRPIAYLRTFLLALGHRAPGMRGLALAVAHFTESILLADELKRSAITRLHNHFANSAATVGLLATRLVRLPWSFTMHGISETDYPAGLLLARKIEAAEFVACVSYFGRAQAMRLVAPEHWGKLRIVRCGLPLDTLPGRPLDRIEKRLICVGRLSPEKGQAGLLCAFAEVSADHPEAELIFVGDGPLAPQLHERADKLHLTKRVHFTGRLGEIETLAQISRADILILPSFMEGLPIVLMEAMAVGTAVIASRVAGIPELVKDGVSGILFTPSDWAELAQCIRRLLNDDALRQELVGNARTVIMEKFDVRCSAQQLMRLFESSAPANEVLASTSADCT